MIFSSVKKLIYVKMLKTNLTQSSSQPLWSEKNCFQLPLFCTTLVRPCIHIPDNARWIRSRFLSCSNELHKGHKQLIKSDYFVYTKKIKIYVTYVSQLARLLQDHKDNKSSFSMYIFSMMLTCYQTCNVKFLPIFAQLI